MCEFTFLIQHVHHTSQNSLRKPLPPWATASDSWCDTCHQLHVFIMSVPQMSSAHVNFKSSNGAFGHISVLEGCAACNLFFCTNIYIGVSVFLEASHPLMVIKWLSQASLPYIYSANEMLSRIWPSADDRHRVNSRQCKQTLRDAAAEKFSSLLNCLHIAVLSSILLPY